MEETTIPTTTRLPDPDTFLHQEFLLDLYKQKCMREMNTTTSLPGVPQCPRVWDDIMCWDPQDPNQTSYQKCPQYIAGLKYQAYATKFCMENGSWYISPERGTPWTNYTDCYDGPYATVLMGLGDTKPASHENLVPVLKTVALVGYSLSFASLIIAFIIFVSIKKLRCPRNVLHMHLFFSFIMRACMFLLKRRLFVRGVGLNSDVMAKGEEIYYTENEANWVCKLFTTLWQYSIMANYSWILMEGLYLNNLIYFALFSDSSSIKLYAILGWGLPALCATPWAICRIYLENNLCWTTNTNKHIFFLIWLPTTISIVINFILFLNIVRVILLKLKSSVSEETRRFRRLAKSTLILVPLFGVHYILFIGFSEGAEESLEMIWLLWDQLFASFQGFFVAVIYCFLNGDVQTEVKKKWNNFSLSRFFERLNSSEPNHMPNGILLAGSNFFNKSRHSRPRASCYSNTSFTSVSVLPAGHCCNLKKRPATCVTKGTNHAFHTTEVVQASLHSSYHDELSNTQDTIDQMNKDTEGDAARKMSQDRRWSESDYNLDNNAMELRSITAPKNFSVNL